ncbi:hypothetical protein HPP92_008767 [Vanilla planifolia]|uniref:DUF1221 domain-containing protein n=1 Tax=Vanilla planifolia TaxID=51239 RepID=A0A835V4T2_VANPL|nr:hypothetical protein HPP92_008767 [Vanilla planifolia]
MARQDTASPKDSREPGVWCSEFLTDIFLSPQNWPSFHFFFFLPLLQEEARFFQGSLKNNTINQRQCLLFDVFCLALMVSEEIRQHLRVMKEGEQYVRFVWNLKTGGKEAIETAGEISGRDHEAIQKKRIIFTKKYEREWMDPSLFLHRFARYYLVSQEMCIRFGHVWKEDRWILTEMITEKKSSSVVPPTKQENQLADLLMAKRIGYRLFSVLVGIKGLPSEGED